MSEMLTQTSELGVRAVVCMAMGGDPVTTSWTPARLAEELGCSPSYLSKTLGQLVKMGILSSLRGPRGGVRLARPFDMITLLDVVQACQGMLVPDYCASSGGHLDTCSYHLAMQELHEAMAGALAHWKLSDLLKSPMRMRVEPGAPPCKMRAPGLVKILGKRKPEARNRR